MTDLLEKVKRLQESSKAITQHKWPRHYADEIMLLKTREERRAALELVPEDIKHVVRFYVATAFARRNNGPLPTLAKATSRR